MKCNEYCKHMFFFFFLLVCELDSIPRLLMLWLLSSPGHRQPWYLLSSINWSLSSLSKALNYLSVLDQCRKTGIMLCMRPANERRRNNVTSLIGWVHT